MEKDIEKQSVKDISPFSNLYIHILDDLLL